MVLKVSSDWCNGGVFVDYHIFCAIFVVDGEVFYLDRRFLLFHCFKGFLFGSCKTDTSVHFRFCLQSVIDVRCMA